MKKVFHVISILLLLIVGCNQNEATNNIVEVPYQLSENLKEKYNLLSNRKSVIGTSHYRVCGEQNNEHLKYLRDSSSKSDLLWMLADSSEKAFKLFLIEEIHRKHPELDSMLLSKYENDTTVINFYSSCIGFQFQKEFGDVCTNIIKLNAFDELMVPANNEAENKKTEEWARHEFFEFQDYKEYRITDTISIDLNGNGILELIYFDKKDCPKLIIAEKGQGLISIGCGKEEYKGFPNAIGWVDLWCVVYDKETFEVIVEDEELVGDKIVSLERPSVYVGKEEAGGGIITYRNGEFYWVHQSD